MKTICATCRFFDRKISDAELHAQGFGFCHLKPPTMIFLPKVLPVVSVPRTNDEWWCGEWKNGLEIEIKGYYACPNCFFQRYEQFPLVPDSKPNEYYCPCCNKRSEYPFPFFMKAPKDI